MCRDARIVDGKYVNWDTCRKTSATKTFPAGKGHLSSIHVSERNIFPSSTAENPVKTSHKVNLTTRQKENFEANEENEHSIAFGILLTASSEQKEHFIRGIVDAYNRYTSNMWKQQFTAVSSRLKKDDSEHEATLFNMLGYGTQHGRNDTELFPSSLHLHETSDNNAAAARNSASRTRQHFSGNIFHSTHTFQQSLKRT